MLRWEGSLAFSTRLRARDISIRFTHEIPVYDISFFLAPQKRTMLGFDPMRWFSYALKETVILRPTSIKSFLLRGLRAYVIRERFGLTHFESYTLRNILRIRDAHFSSPSVSICPLYPTIWHRGIGTPLCLLHSIQTPTRCSY
jgi:hypothetical protein